MAEYDVDWRQTHRRDDPKHAWEEVGSTLAPSAVEMTATGLKGAPDVFARFEIRDGIPETVDFRIVAKEDGRPVRSADLREWSALEGIALNAFHRFAWKRKVDPVTGQTVGGTQPEDDRDHWAIHGDLENARAQRRGPSVAELEDVARTYREAIDGRPTEAVQVMFGYSRRTAARRVQQAREAGLLPSTTPGKKRG